MFGFCAAEVSSCGDVFPRPSLGAERGKEFGDECDTFVLDEGEDVREEEMEFENAEQESERAKAVLDPAEQERTKRT